MLASWVHSHVHKRLGLLLIVPLILAVLDEEHFASRRCGGLACRVEAPLVLHLAQRQAAACKRRRQRAQHHLPLVGSIVVGVTRLGLSVRGGRCNRWAQGPTCERDSFGTFAC